MYGIVFYCHYQKLIVFSVNNRNTITMCERYSDLTIKTDWRLSRRSGALIVKFEQILRVALVFVILVLVFVI